MKKTYGYRLRTYLNATHAMRWENSDGATHPHTWEIICKVRQNNDDEFLRFNEIEAAIQEVVTPLQGRLLNNVAPFTEINPSLENLGDYFFDEIDAHLQKLDCYLEQLEIGESPTRFFSVTRGEQ